MKLGIILKNFVKFGAVLTHFTKFGPILGKILIAFSKFANFSIFRANAHVSDVENRASADRLALRQKEAANNSLQAQLDSKVADFCPFLQISLRIYHFSVLAARNNRVERDLPKFARENASDAGDR